MKRFELAAWVCLALAVAGCDTAGTSGDAISGPAEPAPVAITPELLPATATGPYAPRNECLDEPGASAFLLDLRRAVEARDVDAFLALSSEDIYLDYGGGSGRATLRERFADPEYALWDALDTMMELGCASDGESLTLPWYFAQPIETEADGSDLFLVLGDDVPVLAAPGENADELGQISWDLVHYEYVPMAEHSGYYGIRFPDDGSGRERTGFLPVGQLRSYIDYRLLASRQGGRWRITTFIAGD